MKPILEKIDIAPNLSFVVRAFKKHCHEYIWHFHPEYEITYVKKGYGKRYMAGKLESFGPGDLVLIGKNIPHYYINNDGEEDIDVIVIHFKEAVFGGALFSSPEFSAVASLLEKSNTGISIEGNTNRLVFEEMEKIQSLNNMDKVISFLKILNLLAISKNSRPIGGPGFIPEIPKLSKRDFHRINIIFDYIEKNYNRPIELKEMAELVHMTIPAFCRYFKRITRKSFISFLNEYRIGYACKLLIESDKGVGDISYECGFNNIANFNRQFKSLVKTSPLKYKKSLAIM